MTALLYDGSPLLLQGSLFDDILRDDDTEEFEIHRFSSTLRQAFAAFDNEGALLVVEADISGDANDAVRADVLQDVARIASSVIRRSDIVERVDELTLAICLPGSGRIGMTRVADAIRQQIWGASRQSANMLETVTIGAVHTTDAHLVDINELLLAARVNLDAARAAGGNRTNWSDWGRVDAA